MRLHGLKSRPDLNGSCALVESYSDASDRWNVRLVGSEEGLALKAASLSIADPEAEHSALT